VKLKDIAEINPRKSEIDKDTVDEVSFVAMADVSEDGFISEHETRSLSEVYSGYTYFKKDDVLLAKITPCFENGKAAIADNIPNEIGFGSSEFHVLRTNGKVLPKYLFYALWNEPFREHGSKKMTGSAGQKRVPTNFLKNYEIPLPSLSEQKAIVAKLDRAQRLIDIDKEMLAKYDELIQSVFLDMFGDPVTNSKGWEVKKLGDLTTKVGSGSTPRGGSKVYQDHGNIFIRSQNVLMNKLDLEDVAYISDEIHEGMKNTWVQENDVLLNITGASIGRVCVYNKSEAANVNQHVCILRPIQEEIMPYYLSHLISSKNYQDRILGQQTGGTRQAFNMTQIKNFDIPLPPVELQTQFNEMLTKLKDEIQSIKLNSKKSEELFSSLVQGAFGNDL
jgi:type I restriction enzyme S subunit